MIVLLLRQNTIRQISSHLSHQKGQVTTFNWASETQFSSQFYFDDCIWVEKNIGRNMFILLLGLLSLNDTLREKCIYSYTGYLSSLLSSLFCDVLSNNINNIEKLHQRIFFFFPKCVQLLIFHTMSSTNKVFLLFRFRWVAKNTWYWTCYFVHSFGYFNLISRLSANSN